MWSTRTARAFSEGEEMSQIEIAAVLGVSQMQVSRLLRRVLARVRRRAAEAAACESAA
ncbi:sigma factor-like helix-turn-helix DNA-binding protein [Sinomonas sp. ASV486]|uniref:sigma factor-like helix-turn-helix DNA-binding protein n=1 Tax=Sinomonas sp. ASV486 TaxID=3051170 RepID=UPI0027DAC23B|nr:sigma factor-like helix-turn-helix DNA-binding protein [Sinomonas sp. ASV486]MDQ4488853.1 sigma factor-like helix-turn-helix DNA-binding protein [Sinomonas sp. ASV486]